MSAVLDMTASAMGRQSAVGIEYLMVIGILTDQCVETAVRDGCDRGFLITMIDDACATHSDARHRESIHGFSGYCRVRSTDEVIGELQAGQSSSQQTASEVV